MPAPRRACLLIVLAVLAVLPAVVSSEALAAGGGRLVGVVQDANGAVLAGDDGRGTAAEAGATSRVLKLSIQGSSANTRQPTGGGRTRRRIPACQPLAVHLWNQDTGGPS